MKLMFWRIEEYGQHIIKDEVHVPSAAFLARPRHVGPNCGAFVRGSVGLLCRPRHSTGTARAEPHRSFCSGPFTSLRGLVDGQAWVRWFGAGEAGTVSI